MSAASLAAYDAILPELPAREAAVLGVLRKRFEDGRGGSSRDQAMTNREIAAALGLERDSVSPRTAKLRQKGLVVEIGTRGPETIYEIVPEPNFVKAPGKRKPKAYYDAIEAAAKAVEEYARGIGDMTAEEVGPELAAVIRGLAK